MKIKKIYEDKSVIVLDKPPFLSVHGDGKTKESTVASYILKNFKKIKGVGENILTNISGKEIEIQRPGIVHRLDKDTTGCLVIAKTQDSYKNMKSQFQNRQVKKEYIALVYGHPRNETGIIDLPIARSKGDFRKKEVVKSLVSMVSDSFRGEEREARTRYKVIRRFSIQDIKVSLVAFLPETGRTHQIRVHTKSIGHGIVGDHLYVTQNEITKKIEKTLFGTKKVHQLLHAKTLIFTSPETGELVKVEAKIPWEKDLKKYLK